MALIVAPERSIILKIGGKCFNPGLAYKDGKRFIVWRKGWRCAEIWGGVIDANNNIANPQKILGGETKALLAYEDPRLFEHNGSLWLSYTHFCNKGVFQAIARLNSRLTVCEEWIFQGNSMRKEKNWQFFSSGGYVQAIYRVIPHTVGCINGDELVLCPPVRQGLKWHWGQPRGGTPPIRIGDEYFSFFHSSVKYHYVAAPYAFSALPPFEITRWPTTHLLIAKQDFMPADSPHVVFPSGALYDDGVWTISYGWHDRFSCIIEIGHDEVLSVLEKVNSKSSVTATKVSEKKLLELERFDIFRMPYDSSAFQTARSCFDQNGL